MVNFLTKFEITDGMEANLYYEYLIVKANNIDEAYSKAEEHTFEPLERLKHRSSFTSANVGEIMEKRCKLKSIEEISDKETNTLIRLGIV